MKDLKAYLNSCVNDGLSTFQVDLYISECVNDDGFVNIETMTVLNRRLAAGADAWLRNK